MELDDMKQAWKQEPSENLKNTDIMQLIHHKTYGPLAALKKAFTRQIVLMAVLPVMLLLTNAGHVADVLNSILFWSYTAFCAAVIISASYNYQFAKKMEIMDSMVIANLERQVLVLEKRKRWELTGLRLTLVFFVILLETVPYLQHYRMLDTWHRLNPVIRFGSYAAMLLFQYFTTKRISYQSSGRHLEYLKGLIKEMK